MGKKQKTKAAIKRRLIDDDREPSPFAGIRLVEKKEEEKRIKPKAAVVKKKPSEIVQGYDPNASFGDILFSYEHTGNPYSLPKASKGRNVKKADFGSILDQWEGRGKPKEEKSRPKSSYTPSRSFADILNAYEGAVDDKGEEKRTERKMEGKAEPAASKIKKDPKPSEYRPSRSFADILSDYENPGKREEEAAAEAESESSMPSSATIADAEPEVPSFFRKEDDEEKRAPEAAWSIFGRNDEFVRPESEKKEEEPPLKKEKKVHRRKYKATRDFSEILSDYDRKNSSRTEEVVRVLPRKEEDHAEGMDLFRKESDDEKRAPEASWSIFGSNEGFVRKGKEESGLPEIPEQPSSRSRSFVSDNGSLEKALEKESIKTFDQIIREKEEKDRKDAPLSIYQLRTRMPQATIDLHGFTKQEAMEKLESFMNESREHGLRKISIITGKGLHSQDGIAIIREEVMRYLDSCTFISEKSSAPLSSGGSGAIWVILKA